MPWDGKTTKTSQGQKEGEKCRYSASRSRLAEKEPLLTLSVEVLTGTELLDCLCPMEPHPWAGKFRLCLHVQPSGYMHATTRVTCAGHCTHSESTPHPLKSQLLRNTAQKSHLAAGGPPRHPQPTVTTELKSLSWKVFSSQKRFQQLEYMCKGQFTTQGTAKPGEGTEGCEGKGCLGSAI